MFAGDGRMQMPTSFNKAVAKTSQARAVDGGAGAWHSHAAYRVGAKAQPPSSSQQRGMEIAQKLGFFSSEDLLGAWHADGQPGLTCSKGVWQT